MAGLPDRTARSYAAAIALAAVSGLRLWGGVSVDVAGLVFDNGGACAAGLTLFWRAGRARRTIACAGGDGGERESRPGSGAGDVSAGAAVLGELHLLRSRVDGVLDEIGVVLRQPEVDEDGWPRVEEATRLARRALVAALGAVPPLSAVAPTPGVLRVGELRVDRTSGAAVVWRGGVRALAGPSQLLPVRLVEDERGRMSRDRLSATQPEQ